MPTLVNNLRAIRGPVTAVPVSAGSGIEITADTQNNQIVISANLEAGSGIEIVEDNGKVTIGQEQPNTWINVRDEVNYNTNVIGQGSFRIYYNPLLKLVSLTCDVYVKAGSVSERIMTWTDRLKPADSVQFALGYSLYVSTTQFTQSSAASARWINGCWVWPVQGE